MGAVARLRKLLDRVYLGGIYSGSKRGWPIPTLGSAFQRAARRVYAAADNTAGDDAADYDTAGRDAADHGGPDHSSADHGAARHSAAGHGAAGHRAAIHPAAC